MTLTSDRRAKLARLHKAGLSQRAIAKELGVHQSQISDAIAHYGIIRGPKPIVTKADEIWPALLKGRVFTDMRFA